MSSSENSYQPSDGSSAAPMRAVCLMGPTATGKTEHAIALCEQFPFEIISVDSALVYRGMDIGTAKPTAELLAQAPHRLIDIRDPWESYSAGEFCRDAVAAMLEITAAGRIPLLVGGTMLYFQALQQGLAKLPRADAELRAQLNAQAKTRGWPALHAELAELDPASAAKLKPTDAQRIQRALEVCIATGQPLSLLQRDTQPPIVADYLNIALLPSDRGVLHERIALRLQAMLDGGFVEELQHLAGLPQMSADVPAMRAVGYRQFWPYLNAEVGLEVALEQAVVATRRLAKRQLTWLRSWPDLHTVDSLKADVGHSIAALVSGWIVDDAANGASGQING
jgi:tRNA dimethylallyltransferase